MEPTTPARALVATGATLMLMIGGSSAPLAGSISAASPPTSPATSSVTVKPAAEPTQGVAPHAEVLGHRHRSRTVQRTTRRWRGAVRTNRRAAVNRAYYRSYVTGLRKTTGYTGNDSRCRPGHTSVSSRSATLRAINFVRSMNGLGPVRFSAKLNARSQRTALMMSANRALSHSPSRGWRCYSRLGAANAGRSNLALDYPKITSAGLVSLYMRDPGRGNTAVGHRRWLLNPFTTRMGTGSTRTANSITVVGPTTRRRPNPAWVSWPTAGYFPRTLEPRGRWSLSAGNSRTDFRKARVQVYRNGHRIRTVKLRVHNGYAQPTLVWQIPANQARSGTYRVFVHNVRHHGSRKVFGRSYTVRMFTPSH